MKKLILMLMLCMPLATFAQKFGHVNAQEIMQSMPEFIKARGEVEAAAKQYDNDLKAMQDELQRKAQDYDKNASTMNETKKKEDTADSPGQPAGSWQVAAGQDRSYHQQVGRGYQGCRQGRRLCLHHGRDIWHPIHQRHSQQGRYCRGEGSAQQASCY